jgi:ABC-type molybdenum transport system ATPase subunit/photorepair protein PhrA
LTKIILGKNITKKKTQKKLEKNHVGKNTMSIHRNLRGKLQCFSHILELYFLTSSILKNKIEKVNFRENHQKTKQQKTMRRNTVSNQQCFKKKLQN